MKALGAVNEEPVITIGVDGETLDECGSVEESDVDDVNGRQQVGKVAKLCRSMYGTRDAASIWGDTWSDVLKESSMKVGTACPAFFCSCDGDLKGLCHGDDFCVVARQKQLQTCGKVLAKRFEVKQTGHIGFGVNDEKQLKILT